MRPETLLPRDNPAWAAPTGEEIAEVLRKAQLSGSRAARRAGVNPRRVREWIGGQREIPFSVWRLFLTEAGYGPPAV